MIPCSQVVGAAVALQPLLNLPSPKTNQPGPRPSLPENTRLATPINAGGERSTGGTPVPPRLRHPCPCRHSPNHIPGAYGFLPVSGRLDLKPVRRAGTAHQNPRKKQPGAAVLHFLRHILVAQASSLAYTGGMPVLPKKSRGRRAKKPVLPGSIWGLGGGCGGRAVNSDQ